MIIYPLIISLFHLDHAAIGVFLGGTIHDVAQVVGAGFTVSEETGNVATFTKLLRVAMLLPVVVALSFLFRAHNSTKDGRQLPGFLIVFALLVVINSLGVIPAPALAATNSRRLSFFRIGVLIMRQSCTEGIHDETFYCNRAGGSGQCANQTRREYDSAGSFELHYE